ncbi:MAG TPA: hypothetical protein VGF45_05370, partial [Polyangia bacterium]
MRPRPMIGFRARAVFPRRWLVLVAAGVLSAFACADGGPAPNPDAAIPGDAADGGDGADVDAPPDGMDGPAPPPFATTITAADDFAQLAAAPNGEVKYLAPVAGRATVPPLTEPCYFQNMQRYGWHLAFLQSFPALAGLNYDAYLALVVRSSRQLWGGAVKPWPAVRHPISGQPGIYVYGIYGDPGSVDAAAI